jgi:hypothetical protein
MDETEEIRTVPLWRLLLLCRREDYGYHVSTAKRCTAGQLVFNAKSKLPKEREKVRRLRGEKATKSRGERDIQRIQGKMQRAQEGMPEL